MTHHSKIRNRNVTLSFYRVRETIVAGIISCNFIQGSLNPADMLSKHWSQYKVKYMLNRLIFCQGDTADYFRINELRGSSGIYTLFLFVLLSNLITHNGEYLYFLFVIKSSSREWGILIFTLCSHVKYAFSQFFVICHDLSKILDLIFVSHI